jgi:hypothetical protein
MNSKTKVLKGYKAGKTIGGVFKKSYNRAKSIAHFKKTGKFKNKIDGSGHLAGEKWAEKKQIDPHSRTRRYSKNSPSFDEGVYKYKKSSKGKALQQSRQSVVKTPKYHDIAKPVTKSITSPRYLDVSKNNPIKTSWTHKN